MCTQLTLKLHDHIYSCDIDNIKSSKNLHKRQLWEFLEKVNRKVQEEPQAEVAANPWHQARGKRKIDTD